MKPGSLRLYATVLSLCALPAAGRAGDYSSHTSGGWRQMEEYSPGNWRTRVWHTASNDYPGASDTATIVSNHDVSLSVDESVAGLFLSWTLNLQDHVFSVLSTGLVNGATIGGGTSVGHFDNSGTLGMTGCLHINDTPFMNLSGAVFDIRTDSSITAYGGGVGRGAFLNYGTLHKSGGAGVSVLCEGNNVGFQNLGGTIEVWSGTLQIGGVRTSTNGTFRVSSNAVLELAGPNAHRFEGLYTGEGHGAVQVSNGTILVAGTTLNFTNDLFRWRGGRISGSLNNTGRVTTESGATKELNGDFNNHGTWTHLGPGNFYLNETVFSNLAGAVFDAREDGQMSQYSGGTGRTVFRNQGLLRKSGGAGTFTVRRLQNLGGTIEVQSGRMALREEGASSGSANGFLNVAAGAVLDLTDGQNGRYYGTWTGAGAGAAVVTGGTMTVSGTTLNFTNDLFRWQGGKLAGSCSNASRVCTEGDATKELSGDFNNHGTWTHLGSGSLHLNETVFSNLPGAVFDIQEDGQMTHYSGTSGRTAFRNGGLLKKSGGAGTFTVRRLQNLGGTIEVQSGRMALREESASSGSVDGFLEVAAGAVLDLTDGQNGRYYGTWTGAGDGAAVVTGGTMTVSGTTLNFTNDLFRWRGGRLAGSCSNASRVCTEGDATKELSGDFNNHGTWTHLGPGSFHLNETVFSNLPSAVFDIQEDGQMTHYSGFSGRTAFRNGGLLKKSGGVGTFTVVRFSNNGGTVDALSGALFFDGGYRQSDGLTRLAGGNVSANTTLYIDGGTLAGTGTVSAPVSCSGTVSPGLSAGRLAISGNYAQGAAGTLAIELGGRTPGTERDVLAVSGNASLGGTLAVTLTNGFAPALTDAFTIVTCGSRSGAFSATNAPPLGADRCWRVLYANTQVNLAVLGIAAEVTAPGDGAVFTAPGAVPLSATVTDTAGAVTQVAFLVNGGLAGVSASVTNPYTFDWAAGPGRHTITCRALDSAGLMITSGPVTVSVAPAAPAGIAAGDGTDTAKVRVTWASSAGASGYQVWRHTANQSASAALLGSTASTAYNDAGAVPGTKYYYWVKATNAWAAGLFSASDSGYRTVPAPGGVTAGDADYADKVRVAWTAVPGCTSYQVFRHTANLSAGAALLATVAAPPYDDHSAAAGTPYYFWVKARRGIATSAFSGSDRGWRRTLSPRVVGDYDGDGLADPAVYTPATGTWKVWLSGSGYAPVTLSGLLGGPNAVPASADFDGDRKTDPAVYTESSGQWIVLLSGSGYARLTLPGLLGGAGWSPCPADFDGDRLADPAVYQEGAGRWKVMRSGSGYAAGLLPTTLGGAGWGPCPADFDGDRLADPAVYAEASGGWQMLLSGSGYGRVPLAAFLGGLNWVPVPADFDGDGKADPAVYKAATREWRVKLSGSGYAEVRVVL